MRAVDLQGEPQSVSRRAASIPRSWSQVRSRQSKRWRIFRPPACRRTDDARSHTAKLKEAPRRESGPAAVVRLLLSESTCASAELRAGGRGGSAATSGRRCTGCLVHPRHAQDQARTGQMAGRRLGPPSAVPVRLPSGRGRTVMSSLKLKKGRIVVHVSTYA